MITVHPEDADYRYQAQGQGEREAWDAIARLWLDRDTAAGIDATSLAEIKKIYGEQNGFALRLDHPPGSGAALEFRLQLRDEPFPRPSLLSLIEDPALAEDIKSLPTRILHYLEARCRRHVARFHDRLMRRPADDGIGDQVHDRAEAVRRLAAGELIRREPQRAKASAGHAAAFLSDEAFEAFLLHPTHSLWHPAPPVRPTWYGTPGVSRAPSCGNGSNSGADGRSTPVVTHLAAVAEVISRDGERESTIIPPDDSYEDDCPWAHCETVIDENPYWRDEDYGR